MNVSVSVAPRGVYLFTGNEGEHWIRKDWQKVIDFCHSHRIDGIIFKCYEIAQGEWNTEMGGAKAVYDFILSNSLECIPYGFFYGLPDTRVVEYLAIKHYATIFPDFCLNMESTWDGDKNHSIVSLIETLTSGQEHNIHISTWANPVDHTWLENILALDPHVWSWWPEEYNIDLIHRAAAQWPKVQGDIFPTYAVGVVPVQDVPLTSVCSLWEYQLAVSNPQWIDSFVTHVKGPVHMAQAPFFTFPVCVQFGDTTKDVGLHGAHDTDFKVLPNYPVVAMLRGQIASITAPKWGKQIGVLTDPKYGIKKRYHAYLHLSAVNPSLHPGDIVEEGHVLGWAGGANDPAQYLGTSNPTGQNFLNDSFNSSQIQVGFALMDGPEYGTTAWVDFTHGVDWSLDPTPVIRDAIARYNNTPPVVVPPTQNFSAQRFRDVWTASSYRIDTGIYKMLLSVRDSLNLNPPTGPEVPTVNDAGQKIISQSFGNFHVQYDGLAHVYDVNNKLVRTISL